MRIKTGYLESMDLLLSLELEIKEKEITCLPITISYLGEICAPLRYYAAYNGNLVSTFQDNLSVPSYFLDPLNETDVFSWTV